MRQQAGAAGSKKGKKRRRKGGRGGVGSGGGWGGRRAGGAEKGLPADCLHALARPQRQPPLIHPPLLLLPLLLPRCAGGLPGLDGSDEEEGEGDASLGANAK